MQLYCFTYAGGNAAFFDFLNPYIGSDIDVVKLEYAGHGTRHQEKFYENFSQLAKDMYQHIRQSYHKDQKYALFGYSMGSISVIETLKQILENGELVPPAHIFLAAHEPYASKELEGLDEKALDEWIQKRTIQFGGIPESLIHNRSFWRVYLPVYRADYLMLSKYDFLQMNLRSKIPVTVFYSESDTPYSNIKEWNSYFVGESEMIPFEGNHFFVHGHQQEIADIVIKKLGIKKLRY